MVMRVKGYEIQEYNRLISKKLQYKKLAVTMIII